MIRQLAELFWNRAPYGLNTRGEFNTDRGSTFWTRDEALAELEKIPHGEAKRCRVVEFNEGSAS